jgi:hypothetical protein
MRIAIPPLLPYAFMAWCSGTTLPLFYKKDKKAAVPQNCVSFIAVLLNTFQSIDSPTQRVSLQTKIKDHSSQFYFLILATPITKTVKLNESRKFKPNGSPLKLRNPTCHLNKNHL